MSNITVLVGNPQRNSRTRLVAEELARQLAARSGGESGATIDLAEVAESMFSFPSAQIDALVARAAGARILIVASPTYKASYTGLLKSFFDRFPNEGLAAITAIPLLTIGSPTHALAVELALRPLLVELGASVPVRGIAFTISAVEDRERIVETWLDVEWPRLAGAFHVEGG